MVLKEYRQHWPLTIRHVFYRLVGAYGYPKDEPFYSKLIDHIGNARRGRVIPFDAIRDDGVVTHRMDHFDDQDDFLRHVRVLGQNYRRNLLANQNLHVEVWYKAAGSTGRSAMTLSKAHPLIGDEVSRQDLRSAGGFAGDSGQRGPAAGTGTAAASQATVAPLGVAGSDPLVAAEGMNRVRDNRETSDNYHVVAAGLNDRWRVIDSCEPYPRRQWFLQQRKGSKWEGRSFCQSRRCLLRAVTEKVGAAEAELLSHLPRQISVRDTGAVD